MTDVSSAHKPTTNRAHVALAQLKVADKAPYRSAHPGPFLPHNASIYQ